MATVPSHQSRTFTITCTGADDGTGAVVVTADLVFAEIDYTVGSLSITPDGGIVNALPNVTNRQVFSVSNLGAGIDTVDAVTACVTYTCTLQTATPLIVAAHSSKLDTVQYVAGAIGSSGTVRLIGTQRHPVVPDTGFVTARVLAPVSPTLSLTPHNGDNHLVGLCVASCFDVMAGYTTPSYTSRDASRSATLMYSSAQAHAMGLIQIDVTDSSARHSQKFSLQLKQSNGSAVTFTNGSTELFFKQDTALTTRLAGQFVATSLTTGVQLDTVIVKSIWTSGGDSGTVTQTAAAIPILITNEQASPFGAGWTLAGLQRLYFPSDTTMLVVTDGAGSITRFTRTCQGCLATAAAADFSTLLRTVDGSGVVTGYRRTYRDGSTATFNSSGYLTSVANLFADSTKFAYDGSNHIQTITDPAGKVLTFAYTSGKLSSITDPGARVSHFSVNASGDLASISDPTNTTTFQGTYDASHRLTQTTDRATGTWKYVYDAAGKLASDSTPSVKVDTTIAGTGTLVTVRLGTVMRSLESAILPASGKGTSTNPADQRVSSTVRAVTFAITRDSTKYAMDRFGAATQIETPTLIDTTFITRDSASRVLSSRERIKGIVVQHTGATYVGPRLTTQTDSAAGSTISYGYDTTYNIVTHVWGTTQEVWNYLNAAKTLIDSSRAGTSANPVSRLKYDTKGRVTLSIDPQADSTRYYYGSAAFQNTDSVYTGLNPTIFRRDASFGRVVRTLNARHDSTVTTLDLLNRAQSVRAQGGATTSYAYDSLSRVRQITDPKGQIYSYHMNALGWADTVTDAVSTKNITDRRDIFEYTKTGAVRAHVDRNHWRTSHAFDRWGRDSVLNYTDARGLIRTINFAYDTAGLWSAAKNIESVDTVKTDPSGMVRTQATWRGTTHYVDSTLADFNGLLISRVLITGTTTPTVVQRIAYGYDANLWLSKLTVSGDTTRFYHNADGVLTGVKLETGARAKIDSIAYGISKVHQSVTATHSATGLKNFNSTYARDSLGRITQRSLADTMWNYTYDAHGQLTKYAAVAAGDSLICVKDPHFMDGEHCTPAGVLDTLHAQTFSYDSVGNRVDNSPTIIAGNRLTSWLGYALSYDSVGNLVHKSKAGFDQYLYWNSLGQLDSVKTNGSVVSFGYDGFGRRARKTIGTSATLQYIYDGAQLATIDSAGTRIETFTYYPGSEIPHSVLRNTGNRQYYLTELGAGSVWGLHDSTAISSNHYRYAPFGLLEDSSEVVKNPLRFAGREYDPETRLYFNRARYYDPELARFISEDPIGQNGGANQYAYAGNDPVNATDPSGTNTDASGGFNYSRRTEGETLGFAGPDLMDPWAGLNSGDDNGQGAYDCRKSGNNWDCTATDPSTENRSLEMWAGVGAAFCSDNGGCTASERRDWFTAAEGPGSNKIDGHTIKGAAMAGEWEGCPMFPPIVEKFGLTNGLPSIGIYSGMVGLERNGEAQKYSGQLTLYQSGESGIIGHYFITGDVECFWGLFVYHGTDKGSQRP